MPRIDASIPDFDAAVSQLRDFLTSQDLANKVHWIFRDEVVWHRNGVYVKVPLSGSNFNHAKSVYESGLKNDLGIRMEILGLLNEVPLCYIWLPKDESEAEENLMLMAKFILSIPSPLARLQSVQSSILFGAYKFFEGKSWLA